MAVIVDHTHRRVLDVLESREKAAVVAWLRRAQDSGLLAQVEEVTIDMWEAYAEAVREVFGNRVRLVIDRFHVMKDFQERLESARRSLQRQLPGEAAGILKGTRWLWITNPEDLEPGQRRDLEELKTFLPELGRLHELRERLRSIFEDRRVQRPETPCSGCGTGSRRPGRRGLRRWIASAVRWNGGWRGSRTTS